MFTNSSNVVVQEVKQGTKLRLSQVNIDAISKRINVVYDVGNMDGENFVKLGSQSVEIVNTPETQANTSETLSFSTGSLSLTNTPVANLRITNGATVYNEGVDYTVSGQTVTSITIADAVDLSVSYDYTVPAGTDYDTALTTLLATESEVWTVLSDMEYIDGTEDE